MGNRFGDRLELVERRARVVGDPDGPPVSEDDLARAICILAQSDSPETREVMAMFGVDVWRELVTEARHIVAERNLVL